MPLLSGLLLQIANGFGFFVEKFSSNYKNTESRNQQKTYICAPIKIYGTICRIGP